MNDLKPKDGSVDIPIEVIKKINGKTFKHPTGDNTSIGSRVEFLGVTDLPKLGELAGMHVFI